jgi:DNA-binding transcriptional LysR family regulator
MPETRRTERRIKLRDLRILVTIAESGSMGKAAAALAVSQPVVSKAVSEMERTLKVRLFDRTPIGIEPTLYGKALLEAAVAVLDELRGGLSAIEFLTDPTAGQITLGCTEPLAAGFIGVVIQELSSEYPGIAFRVITGDPQSLKDRELRQRTIEFAVTPTEGLIPDPQINTELLFQDRQVVVAAATNKKWAERQNIELEPLLKEAWFLPPSDTPIGAYIQTAFRAAGLTPPLPRLESFSVPLCEYLVSTGQCIAMLPFSMVAFGTHLPLKVLELDSPVVPRPTAILTLKHRTISPLARLFCERAHKVAERLATSARSSPR